MTLNLRLLCVACVASQLPLLATQTSSVGPQRRPLHQWRGDGSGIFPGLGYTVAQAGDVDGDGLADVVVGAPYEGPGHEGQVHVYSGFDGSQLLPTFFDPGGWHFGFSVAGVGDINGDGLADLAVGDPMLGGKTQGGPGRMHIISGRNGNQIHFDSGASSSDEFGWSVAGCGDIDADGVPDFAVGATQDHDLNPGPGYVRLYSGATGAVLRTYTTSGTGKRFGHSLTDAGDVDGDGIHDLLIGANGGAGFVQMRSGLMGNVLWQRLGTGSFAALGSAVAAAGDVNADGAADVLAGAPGSRYVRIYRASDGALQAEVTGTPGTFFGGALAGLGDVNQDGYADYCIGAKWASSPLESFTGAAWIYSGATQSALRTIYGWANGDALGQALATVDDLDNDGVAEILVGAPQGSFKPGYAALYSGRR